MIGAFRWVWLGCLREGAGAEQAGNKDNGGRRPPRPREGWTNLVANDSMPARDSGLMVAPRAVSEGWTSLVAEVTIDAFRRVWEV